MKGILGAIVLVFVLSLSAHAAPSTFDVYAYENSIGGGTPLDTHIFLNAGQQFAVTVALDDMWGAGAGDRISNADGLGNPYGYPFGLCTQDGFSSLFGSLVGRIGTGDYFFVGTDFNDIAGNAGNLKFFYWDSNYVDNFGYVTARVNVVPLPAAAWLLVSGLAGIAVLRRRLYS